MKAAWLRVCISVVVGFWSMTEAQPDGPRNAPTLTADPMRGKEAGDVRDDNGLRMRLVWCPPGSFTMGDVEGTTERVVKGDEPKPQTTVTPVKVGLTRGYWIGKYEVTQAEW